MARRLVFRAGGFLPHSWHQPPQLPATLPSEAVEPPLALLSLNPRRLTCKDDQPEAPLGVSQHAAPQQHVLVAQGELVLLPVERSTELVQLVVGRFADHLT